MTAIKSVVCVVIIVVFVSCNIVFAEAVRTLVPIAGTKVSLPVAHGFVKADSFAGLQNNEYVASVMVTEIPGAFSGVTAGFNKEGLASRGMVLIERQDITFNNDPAVLIKAEQPGQGKVFEKYIFAFGDSNETILVTGSYPKDFSKAISAVVKGLVCNPVWNKTAKVDMMEGLPFSLTAEPGFRAAHRIQNTLIYTLDGAFPIKEADDPMFIVGQAIGAAKIADKESFCVGRVLNTSKKLLDVKPGQSTDITISGLKGYELSASAVDAKTNKPVTIYQAIVFGEDTYFIVQAICGVEKFQKHWLAFKKMTDGLKINI